MNYKVIRNDEFGNDIDVKSGRVISNRNMGRLRQALELLTEVIESADSKPEKVNLLIVGEADDLVATKSALQPVLDYYGISCTSQVKHLVIEDADYLDDEAVEALYTAFDAIAGDVNLKA